MRRKLQCMSSLSRKTLSNVNYDYESCVNILKSIISADYQNNITKASAGDLKDHPLLSLISNAVTSPVKS